jgi:hypothetical protein
VVGILFFTITELHSERSKAQIKGGEQSTKNINGICHYTMVLWICILDIQTDGTKIQGEKPGML